MASVYDPLRVHLRDQSSKTVTMTFKQIETVLGRKLPESARREGAWWGNETYPNSMHTQAKYGWIAAGRKADVDLDNQRVTFSK